MDQEPDRIPEQNAKTHAGAKNDVEAASPCERHLFMRLLLIVAAAALLISPRYPYWNLKLAAPQYPKGLSLSIYPDHVGGDVSEVDGLNHYIGMRKIADAAKLERRLGATAIWVVASLLVIAALKMSRWTRLLVIPAILFPPLFLADLYWWLRDSGINLDPKAAFSSSIKPFVPTVLGTGKIGQFRTHGLLGFGYYLCVFAAIVSIFYLYSLICPVCAMLKRRRAKIAKLTVLAFLATLGMDVREHQANAATLIVEPGGSLPTLNAAIEHASPGDTIIVRGGLHAGPIIIGKPLHLLGEQLPVIDGQGRGTVVRLEAPGCELRGFLVRSSGNLLESEDVGVLAAASDLRIEDNLLEDVLFGIYLRQAPRSTVRGNTLRGKELPVARRGDLIRLWYSDDVTIAGNTTIGGRDVVLWYSSRIKIRDNLVKGGRYGLHFMYCNDATVIGNRLTDNSVGAFLMYSRRLILEKNWIVDNRGVSGYGIGLKDMEESRITENVLAANKVGIFLEHAAGTIRDNLLAGNDKGVVLFPSAQGNTIETNSFVENGEQVEIEGFTDTMTTNLWKGNYWSDYRGYDIDGDGIGDLVYSPSRLFERISDNSPALRLFADSPSAKAIDFAAGLFPIFEPKPKFVDSTPRMRSSPPPVQIASVGGAWRWGVLGVAFLAWPLVLILDCSFITSRTKLLLRFWGRGPGADTPILAPVIARSCDHKLPTAIHVSNLTKRFGKATAVDNLSFEINQGESVALWGSNGAGKTTVMRCLLGLLPCQGDLSVLGHPCGPRHRMSRERLGYVPQEVRLHSDDSVRDTVRFYARLRGVPIDRGEQLITDWGLGDARDRLVRQLSGGMKQKLALVVALLADPTVLLLDEPTSNLDARTRSEFTQLLVGLKAQGKTLLFCTHRPSEVWKLADRVIVLEAGRKKADGSPEQVRDHLVDAALLGLVVPADRVTAAAGLLIESGFNLDRTGSRIWIDVADGRKVEAIEVVRNAGIQILDFDLESDHTSGFELPSNGGPSQ